MHENGEEVTITTKEPVEQIESLRKLQAEKQEKQRSDVKTISRKS